MVYRTRIKYTAKQKAEIWDRWQRGESMRSIGRLFDRPSSSIFNQLSPTGGIRPSPRRRSRLALTLSEREEISRGIACDLSLRVIATRLGRAPSTVSREVNRNGGLQHYRASRADEAAWDRAHRPKPCKLVSEPVLSRLVARKLRLHWSPEQIAGWLKRTYPEHENRQVSHETIHRNPQFRRLRTGAQQRHLVDRQRLELSAGDVDGPHVQRIEIDGLGLAQAELDEDAPPRLGQSFLSNSPPAIPHSLQLRENCIACHTGPGAVVEIRVDHAARGDCRQCHAAVLQSKPLTPFERN